MEPYKPTCAEAQRGAAKSVPAWPFMVPRVAKTAQCCGKKEPGAGPGFSRSRGKWGQRVPRVEAKTRRPEAGSMRIACLTAPPRRRSRLRADDEGRATPRDMLR